MTARDSAFAAWAEAAHDAQRWSTMSAATKTEIAESHREPAKVAQRVGTKDRKQVITCLGVAGHLQKIDARRQHREADADAMFIPCN